MAFFHLLSPIRWLFLAHALAGAVALLIFTIPLIVKKGGKVHVRVGWIYTWAMVFVGLSALVITPWRGFLDSDRTPSSQVFALFLFYISILTLETLWFGIVVLKNKNRTAATGELKFLVPPILLIAGGLAVQFIGIKSGVWLLILFPLLGHRTASNHWLYWRKPPKTKRHWWYAHLEGMMVACIATVTAFLVTALPRFTDWPWAKSPLLWILPGLILGTLANRWQAYYRGYFKES